MKRNIFLIVLFSFIILGSCKKNYVDTNRDAYDWNAIEPAILAFKGPTQVYASGQVASVYSVAGRGGSSFDWKIEGGTGTIEKDDANFRANITWDQVTDTTDAMVIVTETTVGGLSATDTLDVTLYKFCPLPNGMDDMLGTIDGLDEVDSYWYGPALQTYVLTDNGGKLNIGGLFYTKLTSWSVDGNIKDGGFCNINFNQWDPSVTIPLQYYATNDEGDANGDWVYWIVGEGTWSNCGTAPMMDLYYDIMYIDPSDPDNLYSMWSGTSDPTFFIHAVIDYSAKKVVSVDFVNPRFDIKKGKVGMIK